MSESRYEALLQRSLQTIRTLKARVAELEGADEAIAIVGIGCRFPGGGDGPDAFFDALLAGVDAVGPVPASRWPVGTGTSEAERAAAWGAFVDSAFRFDAAFFGISEREAAAMDPQQRLSLEVAHDAVAHAGYAPSSMPADTGVFMGIMNGDYIRELMQGGIEGLDVYATTGNGHCFLPGRLSYQFGWTGPSLAVDTACSSSLVAVQLACESLRRKECRAAVAGGVHVMASPQVMAMTAKTGTLSPEGRCRTFDARANGIGRGEGCGVVVLKRLADAQRDGDTILALVRGCGTNQDGRSTNLTAPNVLSQESLLRQVVQRAGIAAGDVGYVETHGTGTPLGDPIEVEAIQEVYGAGRSERCVLGAVKTNIGHLEAAAGIAGLIKAVMALRRGVVPPNLHLRRLNPRIELRDDQFVIPTQAEPLPEGRRLAAVSSFGLSGTNAHVIVEVEPEPPAAREAAPRRVRALPLAAGTASGLGELARRWAACLRGADDAAVDDACWTAAGLQRPGELRTAVVAADAHGFVQRLTALADAPRGATRTEGKLAFLFTGQGSQYTDMGRTLIEDEPVFRAALQRCDAALSEFGDGPSLLDLLQREDLLAETRYTQPVLFALELAAYELWRAWGVEPDVLLGHSLGEYVAAHVAGVWSLADALQLVQWRAELMQDTAAGAMVSIAADEATVRPLLDGLDLAAVNAGEQVVASGETEAVERLRAAAVDRGLKARRLPVTRAFHSSLMDPVLDAFEERARKIDARPPSIPVIGNVDGTPVSRFDAAYLRRQLRSAVRFADGLRHAHDALGVRRFVELGPHPVLCAFGAAEVAATFVPTMRRGEDAARCAVQALADLHQSGLDVDFRRLYPEPRRRFPAPPAVWEGPELRLRPRVRRATFGADVDPILGERQRLPGPAVYWSRPLSEDDLADHRVHGHALVPGAMFLDLALTAARSLGMNAGLRIEPLRLAAPLWLGPEPTALVTTASPTEDGWRVGFSTTPDGRAFVEHAHAIIRSTARTTTNTLAAAREACNDPRSVEPIYTALDTGGIELGPTFRRLGDARCGPGRGLASIAALGGEDGLGRTPLFDACLQATALVLDPDDGRVLVPAGVGSIDVLRPDADPAWAHARMDEAGGLAVDVFGGDGELVAVLDEIELQPLSAVRRGGEHLLWRIAWRPMPAPARAEGAEPWIVLDGGDPTVDALAQALEPCVRVPRPARTDQIPATIDAALARGGGGIVYAWHLGDPETDPLLAQRWAAIGAAQCARHLLEAEGAGRLWLLTRSAVPGDEADPVAAPEHATLWGLGRTLVQEHPELRAALVDLGDAGDAAVVAALLRSATDEDQFCVRGGQVHVARLAAHEPAPAAPASLRGTHLVSGGLGGLGRQLCDGLLARGAARVVVLTRGAMDDERTAWVEQHGDRIAVERIDVADADAVRTLVAREASGLSGVFHLAGVLDDGALINLTPARFETVLRAKISGAWNLHRATAGLDLEHFVLYASVASLLGSPGQANYAAGNAYLDGLAAHRRSHGQVGCSLSWGAVSGAGMSATHDDARVPFRSLDCDEAAAALERVLADTPAAVGIVPVDPAALARTQPRAAALTLLRDLVVAPPRRDARDRGRLRAQLADTPAERRLDALTQWLRRHVAEARLLTVADVPLDAPLSDLGIDSLMGIELRARLEVELDRPLPASLLFGAPGLTALAHDVLDRAAVGPAPADADTDTPTPSAATHLTADDVADMDEAESERLLMERLQQLEGGGA